MLTGYGKREWSIILAVGVPAAAILFYFHWFIPAGLVVLAVLALLSFFRDPHRTIPPDRGAMVSPADGVVSSIHELENFPPLGERAVCIRIFLSVLNVHINRSPCHCQVGPITPKPGTYRDARNPASAATNESNLIVLLTPTGRRPIAAVRQVSGAIARRIVCGIAAGQVLQRGQRLGMIKFGSTTELYLPQSSQPRVNVTKGQRVYGGTTILAFAGSAADGPAPTAEPAPPSPA